jgi:hypothetical protein
MREIIFLNEDVVDDYVKNYKKVTDHEKLNDTRRSKIVRGSVFSGIGGHVSAIGIPLSIITCTHPLYFAALVIPFLVAGQINLIRANVLRKRMGEIADSLDIETLKKIQNFNKVVGNNRELRVIYKNLASELKDKHPDEDKIKELSDELRNKAREQGITFETMYAEELPKDSN